MLHNLFIFSLHCDQFRGRETRMNLTKFNQMEMKERHVYRTTCFAQSSSDFFSIKSKMMDITWRYGALVIRPVIPPPPPRKKDVLFHQTKISLFNSSYLLLTGNKSNTAGRKSVDLKSKTKQTNALNLIQDFFWSKSPYTWCDYATHKMFTLYFSWWGHKLSIHHTNVYQIATLRGYIFVIFQQNTYKGCVPFGKSKKGYALTDFANQSQSKVKKNVDGSIW